VPTSQARWYSPTWLVGRVPGADLEQAQIVIVGGAGRAQECGAARNLHADLEAEGLAVEVDGALDTVHVQDGVVEAADGHMRFPSLGGLGGKIGANCCSVQFWAKRRHSREAAGDSPGG